MMNTVDSALDGRPEKGREMLWYLESCVPESPFTTSTPLRPLPFRIGRRLDLPMVLSSPMISWEHAEISQVDGALSLRDLGSTNGTFVNARRIVTSTPLAEGDILRFAFLEFRLGRAAVPGALRQDTARVSALPQTLIDQSAHLTELLGERAVEALFQPIIGLADGRPLGFEILGRGSHQRLPRNPSELLEIAHRLGAAAGLSHLFRLCGVEAARALPPQSRVFANTHPVELQSPEDLLRSLRQVREMAPEMPFTLEVHEKGIAGLSFLSALRSGLRELGIQLAYDDFGVGQSRLIELTEVPPDVLKFDAALIRNIDKGPASRHTLLSSMVRAASEMGIVTVAEGVETGAALETCRELGFDAAQGYFYSIPAPASAFAAELNLLDDTSVGA
jgi:EAL domain-containing protein (putative c-di-GMP-specific phosphodiesterase class I)